MFQLLSMNYDGSGIKVLSDESEKILKFWIYDDKIYSMIAKDREGYKLMESDLDGENNVELYCTKSEYFGLLINQNKNNDIIAISVIAKGGEFLEKIPGEGTLTAATMLKGTKKFSAQELAQILDENGIIIEPGCSEDYFVINVQTTTAQIDKTMEILDEIINHSTFDDYEIEKKRSELLNKIKQRRDVPMNIALENFQTIIFENSVYSHSNKILEKTLPTVQKDDILKYYNKILDSKNVIISVNGNVDPQKMISEFGSILKNKNNPAVNYSNFRITKASNPTPQVQKKSVPLILP